MATRASDPLIVLCDGSAEHTGQGRIGIQSLHRQHCPNMQDRTPRPTALQGLAQQAKRQKPSRFRHLSGMRNADVLRACWRALKQHAAYGVDRGSAQEDAHNLADHIKHLVARLKSTSARAQLVRRHSLPKGGGKYGHGGCPWWRSSWGTWRSRGDARPSTRRMSCAVALALGPMLVPLMRLPPGRSRGHLAATPGGAKRTAPGAATTSPMRGYSGWWRSAWRTAHGYG